MEAMRGPGTRRALASAVLLLALPACSIRKMAVNSLGNALAEGGKSYASDDDPELVREAVPFGLKTVEALLDEAPRHKGLLFAAASGFTQYAFAFIQQDADFVEAQDLARATALRDRARKHYRRALEYGLRGLEVDHPGFRDALRRDQAAALAPMRKKDVPLLFWTANAWGAAIALSKDDSELSADQNLAEALMRRAMALDETYERGSVHDFFISYEGGRRSVGGSVDEARQHLERALTLSGGHRAWPLVNFAETVSVGAQDRAEFETLLGKALAVDPDAVREVRVANLVAQKRARWLLGRADELFIE
jgi:predicted anti-sigma-YlaC factor YlaD